MPEAEPLARVFESLAGLLDERRRRLIAAAEAKALGFGGVSIAARASGLSRGTVIRGIAELKVAPKLPRTQRVRREGAGRKRTAARDATLKQDLEALVEPVTRGDSESPLRWTCKSVRQLAAELTRMGHPVSHRWPNSDMRWSIASKPIERPWKEPLIRTATPSFAISTTRSRNSSISANR
jgi:Rhodopirellula transposase DDE domain